MEKSSQSRQFYEKSSYQNSNDQNKDLANASTQESSEEYCRVFNLNKYDKGIKIPKVMNELLEELTKSFNLTEDQKNNIHIFSDENKNNEITDINNFFNSEIFYLTIEDSKQPLSKSNLQNPQKQPFEASQSSILRQSDNSDNQLGGQSLNNYLQPLNESSNNNSNVTNLNIIHESNFEDNETEPSGNKNTINVNNNSPSKNLLEFSISKNNKNTVINAKEKIVDNKVYNKFTLNFYINNISKAKFQDKITFCLYNSDDKFVPVEKDTIMKIDLDPIGGNMYSKAITLKYTLTDITILEEVNTFYLKIKNEKGEFISSNTLKAKVYKNIKNNESSLNNSLSIISNQ